MPPEKSEQIAHDLEHCVKKIGEILSEQLNDPERWPVDRRWWLQLGYNLGRISELSGQGRTVWDQWREAIDAKDMARVNQLLHDLDTGCLKSISKQSD